MQEEPERMPSVQALIGNTLKRTHPDFVTVKSMVSSKIPNNQPNDFTELYKSGAKHRVQDRAFILCDFLVSYRHS